MKKGYFLKSITFLFFFIKNKIEDCQKAHFRKILKVHSTSEKNYFENDFEKQFTKNFAQAKFHKNIKEISKQIGSKVTGVR